MLKYLWTHSGPPPPEYLVYKLCKDVYHCRPSELRQEDLAEVLSHLICMGVESRVAAREAEDQKIFG